MTWQPIETAPRDIRILISGGTYLYDQETYADFEPFRGVAIALWLNTGPGGWTRDGYGREFDGQFWHKPTHWMPLPPQVQSSDEEPALAGDTVGAADAVASLTQKIEAQSAIISEKNDLIDKLEAERETLITELERLLEQLGRKDLSL